MSSGTKPGKVVNKVNLSQWHPVAFFSRKMIPAETRYETHNGELLAIVEAFKTWQHYLEGCKHKVLVLTDHNNLRRFMDTKSLSSRQVRWAQELSRYHFRIDYWQGKANGAADALSQYPQRNAKEEATLRAENTKILHRLQSSLANVSGLSLDIPSPLHQILVCGTAVLPQLRRFWDSFRGEIANKGPYNVSIGALRLWLPDLQGNNNQAKKLRAAELTEGWEDIKEVLQYGGLLYIPEIIQLEMISWHHDNPLAGHFGIDKTQELIARKYYWPTLRWDVEAYVKGCNVCLASKAVRHKPYGDLQALPIPTHRWKDLSMDFVTGLPILTDWKGKSYDSILVIVDKLTKMVYYELVKITIDAPGLVKVIINIVVWHHGLFNSIITEQGSLFMSKFWSSLCYFLEIKRRLSMAFHSQTNGQTERQNSTIKAYLRAFVNWEQNDWARLLSMVEFAYNNGKNASIGHTPFELNCGFYLRVSFENNVNPHSRSCFADKLAKDLRKLMDICQQNLLHAQKLQKRAYNKGVKPWSYAAGEKVWLNSKYINTKQNQKLKAKFFGSFQILHSVGK